MAPLHAPHKLALLAAALVALGSLGPWTTGIWVDDPIFGDPTYTPRTTYGGQWLLPVALLAAAALLVAPGPRVRVLVPAALFTVAGLAALATVLAPDGLAIRIFSGWAEVHAGWGAALVLAASALGLAACAVGLPRRDPWKGAPF